MPCLNPETRTQDYWITAKNDLNVNIEENRCFWRQTWKSSISILILGGDASIWLESGLRQALLESWLNSGSLERFITWWGWIYWSWWNVRQLLDKPVNSPTQQNSLLTQTVVVEPSIWLGPCVGVWWASQTFQTCRYRSGPAGSPDAVPAPAWVLACPTAYSPVADTPMSPPGMSPWRVSIWKNITIISWFKLGQIQQVTNTSHRKLTADLCSYIIGNSCALWELTIHNKKTDRGKCVYFGGNLRVEGATNKGGWFRIVDGRA